MVAFFMILFVATLAIAITLTIDSGNVMDFKDSILHVILLNFSSFDMKDNGIYYCIFIMASIFNPLILLNLLIAIMGDTYERV